MPFKVNNHVELLAGHVPFGARSGELYEERAQELEDGVETTAKRYVEQLTTDPQVSLIILTGDAGHGKTHLCRRLVEGYGYEARAALDKMTADPDGKEPIFPVERNDRRPLRIVKDLSQIEPVSRGADILAELISDQASVAVVCANEGRLRDALSSAEALGLEVVLDTLEAGVDKGMTSLDGSIHVVNLNFQSVTAPNNCFLDQVLRRWTQDRRRWRTCVSCDALEWCPIRHNQQLIGGEEVEVEGGALAEKRRYGLVELTRIAEQSGYVLTIREALALVAYLITGGYDCQRVSRAKRALRGAKLTFIDLLFRRTLNADESRQFSVLSRLRRFDPGLRALRAVDDRLQESIDREDVSTEQRLLAPPRTVRDKKRRARERRDRFRDARRIDFFTQESSNETRSKRLGLRHHPDFEIAVDRDAGISERWIRVRDRLVRGLHVIQGIRPRSTTHLYVVDPAFGRAIGGAAILARKIRVPDIQLMSRQVHWEGSASESTRVVDSVDWHERGVVVRFADSPDPHLALDLLQFEFVMRAGGGIAFRDFHGPDIRRVLAQLAALTDDTYEDATREIEVLDEALLRTIQVDVGGRIRVGEQ